MNVFITGANTGIGRATALALARAGARLTLAGRSEERHREVLGELASLAASVRFLPLDLARLSSVRACAESFLALGEPLHVLLNNAGLAGSRGLTADGFELAFGVNHLGHFLLTELLLDRLRSSAPSRIVNVASTAHYQVKAIDWHTMQRRAQSVSAFPEYAVSKLCNVLHAKELARRLVGSGVTTHSLHPGQIASDIWRRVPWGIRHVLLLFMCSNEEGAQTSIYCATSEQAGLETGLYYDHCKPKRPSALAEDSALASELYTRSTGWV